MMPLLYAPLSQDRLIPPVSVTTAGYASSSLAAARGSVARITDAALSSLSLEYLLPALLDSIRETLGVDAGSILLHEGQKRKLTVRATSGISSIAFLDNSHGEKDPAFDRLEDDSLRVARWEEELRGVSVSVGNAGDEDSVRESRDAVRANSHLCHESSDRLTVNGCRGELDQVICGSSSVSGWAVQQNRPIIVEDLAQLSPPCPFWQHRGYCSLMSLPLAIGERVLGVLHLASHLPRRFSGEEVELAQWAAERFALSLDRALRYDDVRRGEILRNAMLDASLDAVIVIDQMGRLVEFNAAASEIFGYEPGVAIGQRFQDIMLPPLRRARHWRTLQRALKRGNGRLLNRRYRISALRADRSEFPCEFSLTPLTIPGEALFMGILRDVSRRTQAEREAKAFQQKLEVANEELQGAQDKLSVSIDQLRALHAHVTCAVEKERAHIAREMHDEFGQALTGLQMSLYQHSQWVEEQWGRGGTEDENQPQETTTAKTSAEDIPLEVVASCAELRERTDKLAMRIREIHQSVRRLAASLHPSQLDDLGLQAAVEWQMEEFQNKTGIVCSLITNIEEVTVEPHRATALFRIVQESLTNVCRHARATHVQVTLSSVAEQLYVKIQDNGRGVTPEEQTQTKSLGLLGIQERARLLGGDASVAGQPGQGTTIKAWLPLADSINPLLRV